MSKSIVLCKCGENKKCPVVTETTDGFTLSDEDQPGKPSVVVTREQAVLLVNALRELGLVW